ncbi:hypothetical protein Sm713_10570 [Streptomyces sp. TS71-3]|nr:hypothetical protein Sm713_10570 [Streptomyces sp. TS71-3]
MNTGNPYTDLDYASREGEERLRRLSGLVAQMVFEVDWLDEEAEMQRRDLASIVTSSDRRTGRPYDEAPSARMAALRLEALCAYRDHSAKFLRRLLASYRDATAPETS